MRPLLLTAAAVTLAFAGCRGWESDQPPVHLIPNMDTQEKGRPYRKDDTGLFPDGRVMRPPVEGTVAIGELGEDTYFEEGLEADGGFAQKFPASIKLDDPALRARGKQRYQIYCSPCHGVKADGKGPVATRVQVGKPGEGLMVAPPSFHDARLKEMTNGQMYKAIKHGVNNGNMPSYASQIPVADRWQVILGVRELQREVDSKQVDEPGAAVVVVSATPTVEYGASLYKVRGCNACHSLDGSRVVGPTWKGIWGRTEKIAGGGEVTVDEAYIKESIEQPNAKVVEGFPPAMPPVAPAFTQVELDSLILFMKEQK